MAFAYAPIYPGMLFDSAERFAADAASGSAGEGSSTPAERDGGDDVIAAMGWALALVPEASGGLGGTLADVAGLVEGLALHGNPLPVIERVAVAPTLLLAAGGRAGGPPHGGGHVEPGVGLAAPWIDGIAEGRFVIAPLMGASVDRVLVDATGTAGGGLRLDGQVRGVDASSRPTHYVVPVRLVPGAGVAIVVVDADAVGADAVGWRSMDGRPVRDLRLAGVTVDADRILARGADAAAACALAHDRALALICVDSAAVLGRLVEQTVDYLNGRVQFGVALSSFQALRHQLVDVYIRHESARGMVGRLVADAVASGTIHGRRARLTKIAIGEGARASAETVIQLHGGMGMSDETPAARLAGRLLANEFRHGDRLAHSAALALRPEVH